MQWLFHFRGQLWWLCILHRAPIGTHVTQLIRSPDCFYHRKTFFRFVW